jgi:hypothetical protein
MSTILVNASRAVSEPDREALRRRLQRAWELNEALGARLEATPAADPEAAQALAEDFTRRRRILYVHLQANRIEPLRSENSPDRLERFCS